MEFDAPFGNIYQRGDLLGCFSFPHQTGHLDLRRGEVQEAVGEAVKERGNDGLEIGLENIRIDTLPVVEAAAPKTFKAGEQQTPDIGQDHLLQLVLVLFPFFEQDLHRDVCFFQVQGVELKFPLLLPEVLIGEFAFLDFPAEFLVGLGQRDRPLGHPLFKFV